MMEPCASSRWPSSGRVRVNAMPDTSGKKYVEAGLLELAKKIDDLTADPPIDFPGSEGQLWNCHAAVREMVRMVRRLLARRYWSARVDRRYGDALAIQCEHVWWRWLSVTLDERASNDFYERYIAEKWDDPESMAKLKKDVLSIYKLKFDN